jgi:hypothetical protein
LDGAADDLDDAADELDGAADELDDAADDDRDSEQSILHVHVKMNTQRMADLAFANAVQQCGSTIVRGRSDMKQPVRVWHRRPQVMPDQRAQIAVAPQNSVIYDRSVVVREHVPGITREKSPFAFAHHRGAIPSEKVEEYGTALWRIMKTYTSNFYKDKKSALPQGLSELAVGARLSSASTADGLACGVGSYEWARDMLSTNVQGEKDLHMLCDIVRAYDRIFKLHHPEEYLQMKYKCMELFAVTGIK